MRLTQNYIKTIHEEGKEYDSINHQLLTQAGFVDQTASGIYTILPPGQRVLTRIENIIREELAKYDAEEITMPGLQPKSLWDQTDRWDSVDVLFQIESRHGQEYGLGPTGEEVVSELATRFINSYRDLPLALYQITPKYRDEKRAKSGILRGREFRMKDLYSFHATQEDFEEYYKKIMKAYMDIFLRCGLDDVKITEASGGDFSKKNSHEFNIITPAGEVDLFYCEGSHKALNEEVVNDNAAELLGCDPKDVKEAKAIEIGNIFDLGTKFSEAFDIQYADETGEKHLVRTASYGIGTTRLLGAIAEVHNDKDGLMWPHEVRPFDAHLVDIADDPAFAGAVYRTLKAEGFDVLYDDRDNVSPGEKFVAADLIGSPVRLLTSNKTGKKVEWKERDSEKTSKHSVGDVIKLLTELYL